MEDDILLSQNSYQLIIANINNHKSPRDHKVRDTIIAIVDEFFRNNNSTLLYICETGDSKQSMRSRLFEYWFSTYNRKALFTMISSSIVDEEGVVNFATIILRNDNPNLSEIIPCLLKLKDLVDNEISISKGVDKLAFIRLKDVLIEAIRRCEG